MKPVVSICCITYNHEKYIAAALDSFLAQDTTFSFEIVIHDDASTDNTAAIIKEYEEKYPEIIKPIYQKENQYSKGAFLPFEFIFSQITGEYIAFCEGDDYWCNTKKLQEQIHFLSNNSEYSACFHAVEVVDTNCNSVGRNLGPYGNGNQEYSMKENIKGGFIHLSSLIMRSKLISNNTPQWVIESRHGDYALAIIVSAKGKVYYIDKIMSSHRIGVENSIMTKIRENYSKENEINYHQQRIETLNKANAFYNYKFNSDIKSVIKTSETIILLLNNDFKQLFSRKNRTYFKALGIKKNVKFLLVTKVPNFARRIAFIKGKLSLAFSRFGRG